MKLGAFNPDLNIPNNRYISRLNAARIQAGLDGNTSTINVARKLMGQIFSALFRYDKYEGIKREITDAVALYTNKGFGYWKPRLVGRNMVKADFKKQDCKDIANMFKAAGEFRSSLSDYQEKVSAFGEHLNDCQKHSDRLNEKLQSLKNRGLNQSDYDEISKKFADHQRKLDAFTSSVIDLGNQWRAGENALKPGDSSRFQDQLKNIEQACEWAYNKNVIVSNSYFDLQQEIDGLEKKLEEGAKVCDRYKAQWTQLQENISAKEESLKKLQTSCSNLRKQLTSLQDLQNYVSEKLPGSEILKQLNAQRKAIEEKLTQQTSAVDAMSSQLQSLKDNVTTSLSQLLPGSVDVHKLEEQASSMRASFNQIQGAIGDLEMFTLQSEVEQLNTQLNEQLNQKLTQDIDVAKATFEGCKASIDSYKSKVGSLYNQQITYLNVIKAEISKNKDLDSVLKKLATGTQSLKVAHEQFEKNFEGYDQKTTNAQNALQNLEKLLLSDKSKNIEAIRKGDKEVNRTVEELRNTTGKLIGDGVLNTLFETDQLNVGSVLQEALKDVPKDTIKALLKDAPQEVQNLFAQFGKQPEKPRDGSKWNWRW